MSPRVTRRQFVVATAAAGAAATVRPLFGEAPAVIAKGPARAIVVASSNAAKFSNGGPRTGIVEAFERVARGEDIVDALIAGVNILELDPAEHSVGYGGLPNADGVVQLDASCMHGAKRRAGAVACLEGVRTPSLVARAVMETTDHHLLVGKGAQDFARRLGFKIEDDLNTDHSRQLWLEWKRRTDPDRYLDPAKRSAAGDRARRAMIAEGLLDAETVYGTVHCNGVNATGDIGGVTTTSGLAWKIPGRVGDSPILGAGNYVDGEIGAAGSTGRGEANLFNLCSFLIVELMRQGKHPKDAALAALARIKAATVEKRLLNKRGLPNFQVKFFALNRKGEHGGAAFYAGPTDTYAICTEKGPEAVPLEPLLPGKADE